jgi:hypothetical protein
MHDKTHTHASLKFGVHKILLWARAAEKHSREFDCRDDASQVDSDEAKSRQTAGASSEWWVSWSNFSVHHSTLDCWGN